MSTGILWLQATDLMVELRTSLLRYTVKNIREGPSLAQPGSCPVSEPITETKGSHIQNGSFQLDHMVGAVVEKQQFI